MPDGRRTHREALMESAEDLARLGSWDQDLRTGDTFWSAGLFRILGREPDDRGRTQEELLQAVHPDDRERVAAVLRDVMARPEAVPADGLRFEIRALRDDRSVREVVGHGRVERDDAGEPVRWVGTLQDVTEQRLTERELHAHYAVNQALREWESFEEGVLGLLRRLGTALEFPVGCLWVWDEDRQRIVCRAFWSSPEIDPKAFQAGTMELAVRRGEGAIGHVWETRRPAVIADAATHPGFLRPELAVARGIESGLAFPAVGPNGTVAVLSFYSLVRREPSMRMLRTLTGMGGQLGRFLDRRRGQLERRRLSERELQVLRLAAAGRSGPEIAEELVVSPSTIKTHFENIYEKLGVGDRAAAVAHALRIGLIQ